ncbi:MAG: hypothetical protein JWN74_3290 [Acidobacteriaceae bacterium]|nr:hypothetical protein [Acidobacteriaceae bacterium]
MAAAYMLATGATEMPQGRVSRGQEKVLARRKKKIKRVLRGVGLTTFVIAVATFLTTFAPDYPEMFWCFAACIYIAFASIAADIWYEELALWIKWGAVTIIFAMAIFFSFYIVCRSAPLDIVATSSEGNYKDGENVEGITWRPAYSELRIGITNPTNLDYNNVDIRIVPALWVVEQVIVSESSSCHFEAASPHFSAVAHGTDANGKPFDEPFKGKGPRSSGLRIRCDKFPRNDTLAILVAVMNVDLKNNPASAVPIFRPQRKVKCPWVYVKGQFTLLQRPHHIEYTYATQQ